MVTIKHHRIDSGKKALVLNLKLVRIWPLLLNPFWSCWGLFVVCSSVNLRLLLFSLRSWQLRMRCPTSLLQTIHRHYDSYKAENSGSLGVPNGVWSFLGDFPYDTFWKILFSIDLLQTLYLWQMNILPTQEYLTTSWSLSSMFRPLVQERNVRGIVEKSNLEKFSMWRRLPHWPTSNVWLRREYTLKKILFHSWLLSPLLLLGFWIHTRARTSNEKRVGNPLRNWRI